MYKIKFEHYVTNFSYHDRCIWSINGISIIENDDNIEIIRPFLIDILGEEYINYHKNKLLNYINKGVEYYTGVKYISEFIITEEQLLYLKLVDTSDRIHYKKIGD